LAGLLNNQALALAGVERHERAVSLYEEAIKAQRRCWHQAPASQLMQETLSKMVYNHGRSLAALRRWDAAADAALARREIWQTDGQRLFGVAVELAGIGRALAEPNSDDTQLRQRVDRETVATLRQAFDKGYHDPRETQLASDERFAHLRDNEQFAKLLANQTP